MTRTISEGKQLRLLPAGAMGPPDDPVGVALAFFDDDRDPEEVWREAMPLFIRMAVRAYYQAHVKSGPEA